MSDLSKDAVVFGLCYLNGPKCKLSFGGEGAKMRITDRARAALSELLQHGYAEPAAPEDQIVGREHYQGTDKNPFLGVIGEGMGLDIYAAPSDFDWPLFVKAG